MTLGNEPLDSSGPEGGERGSERRSLDRVHTESSAFAVEVAPDSEVDMIKLVNLLIRRWRLVFGLPFVACALTAAYSLTVVPTFTATSRIVPESPQGSSLPAGLSGLANQFGFGVGGSAGSYSPMFYAEVLTSLEIMERTVRAQYADPRLPANSGDSTSLLELMEIGEGESRSKLQRAIRNLRESVAVSVDQQTNIIQLSVDAQWPTLAAAVANRIIATLGEFNEQTRRTQAGQRRRFIEERGSVVQTALNEAEQDMRGFYERNRNWEQSPQLTFEERRLRRAVTVQQEVYLTLMREYEVARIDEVNETPVITVVDVAMPPLERSAPMRRRMVLLVAILSGMVGAAWALADAYFDSIREAQNESYVEFLGLLRRARQSVRQAFRWVPLLGRRDGGNAGD